MNQICSYTSGYYYTYLGTYSVQSGCESLGVNYDGVNNAKCFATFPFDQDMPVSRIPHPTSSRTPLKAPATGTPSKARVGATTSTPVRTRTKSTVARSATPSRPPPQEEPAPPVPALSIKEAIALKRAEAKKAQGAAGGSALDSFATLEDSLPTATKSAPVEEDILGRWSVKETIERGRSTGDSNPPLYMFY